MNILVACEESQAVTKELRALGHQAYSCDITDCSGGCPEWHIFGDVLEILNPRPIKVAQNDIRMGIEFYTNYGQTSHTIWGKWDMIIAFPPCTHLAVSGARWFEDKRKDGSQKEAIEFFMSIYNAECDRIAIENPVNIIGGYYIERFYPDLIKKYNLPIKPTQIIQPWYFGDHASKTTCLWLKGLPDLIPDITEKPEFEYHYTKSGRRMEKWMYDIRCKSTKDGLRAKLASKTFPGIAKAMATQWTKNF